MGVTGGTPVFHITGTRVALAKKHRIARFEKNHLHQ
jgi:hypothetical protein